MKQIKQSKVGVAGVEDNFAKLDFRAMVDQLAGQALCEFVKGTPWRSVIFNVCREACAWLEAQPK